MSAKFAHQYCQCGEPIKGDPTYCKHCGHKLGEAKAGEELSTVTGAVREFTEAASEEAREKKYNQQKWGLFETNYQREKGITTEESLQEIEAFQNDGVLPEPAPKREANVGGAYFRENLDKTIRDKEEEKERKKNGGGGGTSLLRRLSKRVSLGRGRQSSTASGGAPGGAPGARPAAAKGGALNEFASRLAETPTSAGAAFFSQFQEKEKQKFKPQFGM